MPNLWGVQVIKDFFEIYNIKTYLGLPPYTAYSDMTRVDILDTGKDPLKLLNSVGEAMQMYRSWGRNGKVNGKDSERNHEFDHDLVMESIKNRVDAHPRRAAFGLPHNYYFSRYYGPGKGEKADVKPEKKERRASPLFIHIQALENKEFAAVATIMPAQFLPRGEKILLGNSKKGNIMSRVDVSVDIFKVLHQFLDSKVKADGDNIKPRFPHAINVIKPATHIEVA
jgi:CRISPR-associated protein Cmr1